MLYYFPSDRFSPSRFRAGLPKGMTTVTVTFVHLRNMRITTPESQANGTIPISSWLCSQKGQKKTRIGGAEPAVDGSSEDGTSDVDPQDPA